MEQQALGRTPHWVLTVFLESTWARASSSTNRTSVGLAKWHGPAAGSNDQLWGRDELHVIGRQPKAQNGWHLSGQGQELPPKPASALSPLCKVKWVQVLGERRQVWGPGLMERNDQWPPPPIFQSP